MAGRSWKYFYYGPVRDYDNSPPPQKKNKRLITSLRMDLFIDLRHPKIEQVETLHLSQL